MTVRLRREPAAILADKTYAIVKAWAIAAENLFPLESATMMTFRQVGEYVTAEPFQPFRIKMASGTAYEVRHSEMILVGRTSVRIHTTAEGGSENGFRWHDVSLMLMETVEPIRSAVSGQIQES